MPEIFEPVTAAVQAKAPVELVRVHPVLAEPPPKRMFPVEVLFKFKAPEDPASRVSVLVVAEERVTAPAPVYD